MLLFFHLAESGQSLVGRNEISTLVFVFNYLLEGNTKQDVVKIRAARGS